MREQFGKRICAGGLCLVVAFSMGAFGETTFDAATTPPPPRGVVQESSAPEKPLVAGAYYDGPLAERFNIGGPRAHHIVLLDTSGSMRPFFTQVLDAVRTLLQAFPVQDTLTVFQFDDFPRRLAGGKIESLDLAQALPAEANGQKTDIGNAFVKALDEIEQSGAEVVTLFFLTDGVEDLPDNSPFKTNHDAAWSTLTVRGMKACDGRELAAFGLGLKTRTDVGLLTKVFPSDHVEVVTLNNPAELRDKLQAMAEKVRHRWLKKAVGEELSRHSAKVVELSPMTREGGRFVARYAIESTYPHLPLSLVDVNVAENTGLPVWFEPAPPYEVGPASPRVEFSVIADIPQPGDYLWWKPRKQLEQETAYSVTLSSGFEDAEELARLGFTPEISFDTLAGGAADRITVGSPKASFAALGIGPVLLLFAAVLWLRLPRPIVYGKVMVPGAGVIEAAQINKPVLKIGPNGSHVPVPDGEGALELSVARQGGFDTISLKPVEGVICHNDEVLGLGSRKKIDSNTFDVFIGPVNVTLIGMSSRRAPRRGWKKVIFLAVLWLVILGVSYQWSPW